MQAGVGGKFLSPIFSHILNFDYINNICLLSVVVFCLFQQDFLALFFEVVTNKVILSSW